MEREYGVMLSSRDGRVKIRVTATGVREARKAVQAKVPSWRIGQFGGTAYTGSYTAQLAKFSPAMQDTFITLAEAEARIARDGWVKQA